LIQQGYLPTTDWYIESAGTGPITINTPGYFSSGDTYYLGFWNTQTTDLSVSVTVNYTVCSEGLIGPGCAVNQTNTNSTDGTSVISVSATLTDQSGGSDNDGNAWEFSLKDDTNEYVYFQVIQLPTFADEDNNGFPYYVRASVGNTNLEDDDENNQGPTIYAKKNGIPSAQSYDTSATGSVANQVLLQVNEESDQWYLAVTPADFSIWLVVNCAGNCSANEHGSCLCGTADGSNVDCDTLSNSTNLYPLYQNLPITTSESSGSCSCSDNDYDLSFDCSQKSSPTVLFIVLIVIGGLIILFVAIGVPLYCYISNKRKERYERI